MNQAVVNSKKVTEQQLPFTFNEFLMIEGDTEIITEQLKEKGFSDMEILQLINQYQDMYESESR